MTGEALPFIKPESDIMKKPQPKPADAVDRNLVLRDLHRLDPDLLKPSFLAAINELPEHRRAFYLARLDERLAQLDQKAKAA
jgi:hypothetical protein